MKRLVTFIPNSITISRIVLSVIFVVNVMARFVSGRDNFISLIAVFLAICLSDFMDGRIARKLGCTSVTGAKLDVLADLFFIASSNIILIKLEILPMWFLVFIVLKFIEFIMTSNLMLRYKALLDKKVFMFDKIGRMVAVMFFAVPGAACIFQILTLGIKEILIDFMLYLILSGGVLSSYIRIKSCLRLKTQGRQGYKA